MRPPSMQVTCMSEGGCAVHLTSAPRRSHPPFMPSRACTSRRTLSAVQAAGRLLEESFGRGGARLQVIMWADSSACRISSWQ